MRQFGWVEGEDFRLIVALARSEDETEIGAGEEPATQVVKNTVAERGDTFRRKTRSALYWTRLRGEDSIVEVCRCEGTVQNLYYRWSKDFLEAGKKRLAGDATP